MTFLHESCTCLIDDDPDEGYTDMRGCPVHDRDEEFEADALQWWRSQQ